MAISSPLLKGTPASLQSLLILALMFPAPVVRGLPQQLADFQTNTGTISGMVRDSSGAALAGVRLTLMAEGDPHPIASISTDSKGTFSFEQLKAGSYKLHVGVPGYREVDRNGINVQSSRKVVMDLALVPEASPAAPGNPVSRKPGANPSAAGYFDGPQLKPGELSGSIDPGGYSAPGDSARTRGLLAGAANLKGDSRPKPSGPTATLSKEKLAALEDGLRQELRANPQSFEANHNLGEFYIQVSKLPSAIPYLEKAYEAAPAQYDNAYDLALAYLETKNYAAARKQLQAMLARQDTAELHNLLAEAEEKSGNFIEAASEYERAAHLDPSEQNLFDWGSELLIHQTFEPAIKVLRGGVERYPRSSRLLIGLGIALYSRGQYDEAIQALANATDVEPSDTRPYLFLARMYNISTTAAPVVSERLKRFAEFEPQNPQALYYYALSLWKGARDRNAQANLVEIEGLLRNAAKLDPRFADVHLQLGILNSERKDYATAIQEYEQAVRLNPGLADAHYRLGQALTRVGEKTRAQEEFKAYGKLHAEQLAESEKERAEIRQFVYTLQENPE